jgi:exodeoxyribonuclease III
VPQGNAVDSEKFTLKLVWFRRLRRYFDATLSPQQPALWLGDLNVAPEPIDVYHPENRVNDPDFHIDARNASRTWSRGDSWMSSGSYNPDVVQYTYWDYYRNAFKRNFGWRIDHLRMLIMLLPVHILAGGLAIVLGGFALAASKGATLHREAACCSSMRCSRWESAGRSWRCARV